MFENYIKEDFLFCKPIHGRVTSLEVLDIMNRFQEDKEINWEKCIGPALTEPSQCQDKMGDFMHG
jgi:hypothetical protein